MQIIPKPPKKRPCLFKVFLPVKIYSRMSRPGLSFSHAASLSHSLSLMSSHSRVRTTTTTKEVTHARTVLQHVTERTHSHTTSSTPTKLQMNNNEVILTLSHANMFSLSLTMTKLSSEKLPSSCCQVPVRFLERTGPSTWVSLPPLAARRRRRRRHRRSLPLTKASHTL